MKPILGMLCLSSVVTLGGCAIAREMYLPDGSVGYNIQCDGSANSISNCFQKAGELCGSKGYALLNREGEMAPFGMSAGSISANSISAKGAYVTQTGAFVSRSLFIKCNQ
jgi:hypothetical protein